MALPATDNFNRGTGTLGTNWTYGPTGSDATSLKISSSNNAVVAVINTDVAAFWNADTFGNDQYSKFSITSGLSSGTGYAAALARCSGTGGSFQGYQVTTDGASGSGHTEIHRWNASAITVLKAVATTFTAGDVLEIRVSGSATVNIALYKNGALIDSFNDSSGSRIASGGAAGIGGFTGAADVNFDDWEGGNLAGSSTTVTPTTGSVVVQGRAPTTSAFTNVRIRDVLVNESGQPVGGAANITLLVWYSGRFGGAPDVSLNGFTTDAAGTASWSIPTGSLAYNQPIAYVAQDSLSFSNYTCARMIPAYE